VEEMTENERMSRIQKDGQPLTKDFFVNGLKARSSKVVEIPVLLRDPQSLAGFYKNFNGSLETTIQYNEFATSTVAKNAILVFPEIPDSQQNEGK
jgi:hypothetical protein